MATHSSILAWEITWTEEPGGLHSMGSRRADTTGHSEQSVMGVGDRPAEVVLTCPLHALSEMMCWPSVLVPVMLSLITDQLLFPLCN